MRERLGNTLDRYLIERDYDYFDYEMEGRLNRTAQLRLKYADRLFVALGLGLFFHDVRVTLSFAHEQALDGLLEEAADIVAKLRFRIGYNDHGPFPMDEPLYFNPYLVNASLYEVATGIVPDFGSDTLGTMVRVADLWKSDETDRPGITEALAVWIAKYDKLAFEYVQFAERINASNRLVPAG